MPIYVDTLTAAIKASGGAPQDPQEVAALFAKLQHLEATGRFGPLIGALLKANDRSNFLALVLEATFAYQFEGAGVPLEYEVRQVPGEKSSIDFAAKFPDGKVSYFELRLLQQDQATSTSINAQLAGSGHYEITKNGADEQHEILRLQNAALDKVQNAEGKPVKFLKVDTDALNIVVLCVSDLILKTIDEHDCILATYGDEGVAEEYRRGVFGLFQTPGSAHPEGIQQAAKRFAHFRGAIHGVLFLFRSEEVLNYSLTQVLVWNRALVSRDDARRASEQVVKALGRLR